MTTVEMPATTNGLARLRQLFVAVRTQLVRIPLSLFLLGMRIGVGMMFLQSGLLKLRTWEFTVKLFSDEYKVPLLDPELAARIASFCELTFPPLLFVGLATRLATLPLIGMVIVIELFVYPVEAWPDNLLWGSVLVFILSRGPGVFSLDYLVERFVFGRGTGGASKGHRGA